VSSPSSSPPPQASRGGVRWRPGPALSGVLLLAVASCSKKAEPVAAEAPKPAAKAAVVLAEPPPPPPPEPEPVAAPPPVVKAKSEAPKSTGPKGPAGCDAECIPTASAELQSALRARAGQARSCYERALTHNSELQGSLEVSIRIGPTGAVCSAEISKDTLGDSGVASCVAQRFRSAVFPKSPGGCVDAVVPIKLVPRQP